MYFFKKTYVFFLRIQKTIFFNNGFHLQIHAKTYLYYILRSSENCHYVIQGIMEQCLSRR